jgi:hypothetical protein
MTLERDHTKYPKAKKENHNFGQVIFFHENTKETNAI